LKTVHPDQAPIPSMTDAAYHHHQTTSASLLANVYLDDLEFKDGTSTPNGTNTVAKPNEAKK